jgi:hypothetical protein
MGYRTLILAAPAVAATFLAAGCGSQHASKDASSTVKPSSPAAVGTSLTIKYTPDTGQATKTWRLTCDPVGGDHPDAQAACAALAAQQKADKNPFAPVPKGQMCTMIFGGPQVTTVSGTWQGKTVNATFDKKNGCETTRWNTLAPLVGQSS